VERNAGEGSGINDQKFTEQGAETAFSSKDVYEASALIISEGSVVLFSYNDSYFIKQSP
jgi:alanine dehydrogenase